MITTEAWTPGLWLLICRYVRTYARSVNHVTTKQKEVDHIPWVGGSVPRALRKRRSPANIEARFSKVPIINGPGKLASFYIKDRGFNSFASNTIKLSVNETKWSSLLARTRALILYISIWIFDFGPAKLPGLSRNGPQDRAFIERRMTYLSNVQFKGIACSHLLKLLFFFSRFTFFFFDIPHF